MAGVVGTSVVAQIGFIVKDVEKAKADFAEFLGLPVPRTKSSGEYAVTKTRYKGEPAPDARCYMAFFEVGPGLQIELIQPNESPSTWRDFLDTHGEGVHHLAFRIKGMEEKIAACESFGMTLEQNAEYSSGTGRYAYLAAYDKLKVLIELLENDTIPASPPQPEKQEA